MATEYIKREDAIETICNLCRIENDDCSYPRCSIINNVRRIPAADVVERKRGSWIVMNDEYIDDCKCSECGCIEYFNKGWKRFNFCPNCGARMADDGN